MRESKRSFVASTIDVLKRHVGSPARLRYSPLKCAWDCNHTHSIPSTSWYTNRLRPQLNRKTWSWIDLSSASRRNSGRSLDDLSGNLRGYETTCLLGFLSTSFSSSQSNKSSLRKSIYPQSSQQGLLQYAIYNLGSDGWNLLYLASPSYQR